MSKEKENVENIVDGLKKLLATSYTLFLKTHYFHWNVKGPMFYTLHTMFETQYTELFTAIDEIAEHILTLGYTAPGTFKEFSELTLIKEEKQIPKAVEMIEILVKDHATLIQLTRDIIKQMETVNLPETEDLLIQRVQVHEKTAWMLKSLLE